MPAAGLERMRYYRKNVDFFKLVDKIKLWPSRRGTLHGIKSFVIHGNIAEITTHCGEKFIVHNSRHSRAARFLRNKLFFAVCPVCRVPEWKLAKYASTTMSQRHGAVL